MEFEYTDCFYVENDDLRKMYLLCKNKGYTPQEALNDVARGWDDCEYYAVGHVEDQIIAEIERRLTQAREQRGVK